MDKLAVLVFVIELVAKVMASGLLLTPNAYLKEAWNVLDFVIVLSSLFSMIGEHSGL